MFWVQCATLAPVIFKVAFKLEFDMLSRALTILPSLVVGLCLLASAGAHAEDATVAWESGDALYLAGANILVSEDIDDNLRASGDSIVIADDVTVDGNVWLAGRHIVVDGRVDGDIDIRGRSVLLNGPIDGNVSVWAVDLTLGPDAAIDGDLTYYTRGEADMARDATISGDTEAHFFSEGGEGAEEIEEDWRRGWEQERGGSPVAVLTLPGVVVLAFFAGLVALFASGWSEKVSIAATTSPALALLYGSLWMIGLPVIAIFAAVTVVGIPFAVLLMLLYGIVFLLGMVLAVLVIGRFATGFFQLDLGPMLDRLLIVVAGALILWAGAAAPLLGGFFWFASIALGIGAMLIAGRVSYEAS
ncbi:MAG: polymer-forming cytoskeletal protein [Parvibaculum sp.]